MAFVFNISCRIQLWVLSLCLSSTFMTLKFKKKKKEKPSEEGLKKVCFSSDYSFLKVEVYVLKCVYTLQCV